jgi:hypothetical protein
MKLAGILSSKGRHAVHERNNTNQMPTEPLLSGHQPVPQPSGAFKCSGCTGLYSPAAFARHLTGAPIVDGDCGVYITGGNDPWLTRPEESERAAVDAEAEWRQKLIEAYWLQRDRPTNSIAEGTRMHPFFD